MIVHMIKRKNIYIWKDGDNYEEDLQDFLRILNVIIRAISMEVVLKKLTVEEGKQRLIREIEILKKGIKKL